MAADRDGDGAFWSKVQKQELPHCGLCDPATRQVELDDGRIARCPRCHPLQDALMPQTWRCGACHALIYRDQRGLPCSKHRTVAGWHREFDQAQAGRQDPLMPDPGTETGAKAARTQLAARPRPAAPAADPMAGLWGEALARAQVAEARAARERELPPDAPEDTDADDDYEPPF
jgi:hypothetical protein